MGDCIVSNNCDASGIEEFNGYTIEHAEGDENDSSGGFSITAYREISGIKVYREFFRNNGEYYISEEYIPDWEKKRIKEKLQCEEK